MTSPHRVPFQQVDVFTAVPFKGNPVAVVLDGDALSSAQMQAIANWTNLSETTFVCTPTQAAADYRLRIFTPRSELPFAGHPTLGSAWAVLQQGLQCQTPGRLMQECGKGLVALRVEGQQIFFALPQPAHMTPTGGQLVAAAHALGISVGDILRSAIVDVGAVWLTLHLRSAQQVLALEPDMAALAELGTAHYIGVTVFGMHQSGNAVIEVRSFAPACGVPEDPACGSGNGCVAALIRQHKLLDTTAYVAAQGRRLGRDGNVFVEYAADGTIWLGGHAVTCVEGTISL